MCETSLTGEEETLAGTLLLSILDSKAEWGFDPIPAGSEVLLPSRGCREEPGGAGRPPAPQPGPICVWLLRGCSRILAAPHPWASSWPARRGSLCPLCWPLCLCVHTVSCHHISFGEISFCNLKFFAQMGKSSSSGQ